MLITTCQAGANKSLDIKKVTRVARCARRAMSFDMLSAAFAIIYQLLFTFYFRAATPLMRYAPLLMPLPPCSLMMLSATLRQRRRQQKMHIDMMMLKMPAGTLCALFCCHCHADVATALLYTQLARLLCLRALSRAMRFDVDGAYWPARHFGRRLISAAARRPHASKDAARRRVTARPYTLFFSFFMFR